MTTFIAAMSGVEVTLQSAATTGNGTTIAIPPSFNYHNFKITAASGVTAGAVTIEISNDPNDTNTWAALPSTPTQPVTVMAGADLLVPYTGRINFVRARISTTISGGANPSVTVTYFGAKQY